MLQSRVQLKKEGVKTLKTNKNERKYPILIAYDTGSQYAVWCPYCFKWHFHGKKDGMRVAHCTNPHSPFKKTGYIIKLATRNDLDFKSHNLYPNDYPMFEEN
ncbi:hypothetical protein [Enterococcus gallinarum]|uniref:hypothetical protein n=1 Tax=Enterococcus gallinarum TaxID=1353 RepID=UPI001E2D3D9F|nr:hypothetical protein [Enterococcus gallinarum]